MLPKGKPAPGPEPPARQLPGAGLAAQGLRQVQTWSVPGESHITSPVALISVFPSEPADGVNSSFTNIIFNLCD